MSGPISNVAELVEALHDSIMCRDGDVVSHELALERAKNMATYLIEIVQQAAAWRKEHGEGRCADCAHTHAEHNELGFCGQGGCGCHDWIE